MSGKSGDSAARIMPRMLRRESAAAYLGVSPSYFDGLVKGGTLPNSKVVGKVHAWDRHDLDEAANAFPYVNEVARDTSWD